MKHLTNEQRYQIKAYLDCGKTQKFIANELKVSKSTISREISRNSSRNGYFPEHANNLSEERKERFCRCRKLSKEMIKIIEMYIKKEEWSPEQIIGYCNKNNIPIVSVERIYQYIREDKANGGDLFKSLRHKLKHRKRPVGGGKKEIIKDKVSIDLRPDIINNRERFGDWEIDLIVGENNKGAIVTIVERTTSFLLIKKLNNGKNAKFLAKTVINMLIPYKDFILSITSDNGSEFAEHKEISKRLNTDFFFAHPYSSWERGLNEYSNKLIRQYIPKKETFDKYNDLYISQIQAKLNKRPRKKLNFETPKDLFFKFVNNKVALVS